MFSPLFEALAWCHPEAKITPTVLQEHSQTMLVGSIVMNGPSGQTIEEPVKDWLFGCSGGLQQDTMWNAASKWHFAAPDVTYNSYLHN